MMNVFYVLLGIFLVYCGICGIKYRKIFGIFRFEKGVLYKGKWAVFEGIILLIIGMYLLLLTYLHVKNSDYSREKFPIYTSQPLPTLTIQKQLFGK